jgi:hypothetical protein
VISGKRRSGLALGEDGGRGVYPSVVRERVCKRIKLKEINGVPLEHDGE